MYIYIYIYIYTCVYSKANVVNTKAPRAELKHSQAEFPGHHCTSIRDVEISKDYTESLAHLVDTKTSLRQQWHLVNKTICLHIYTAKHISLTQCVRVPALEMLECPTLYKDIKHRGGELEPPSCSSAIDNFQKLYNDFYNSKYEGQAHSWN